MDKDIFFNRDDVRKSVSEAIKYLSSSTVESFERSRNNNLISIFKMILDEPDWWSYNTQLSIAEFSSNFDDNLLKLNSTYDVDSLYVFMLHFVIEAQISTVDQINVINTYINLASYSIESFSDGLHNELRRCLYSYHIVLTKKVLSSNEVSIVQNFDGIITRAENLEYEWEKKIDAKVKEVNKLNVALDTHKSNFNFVGLNRGFSAIYKMKIDEAAGLRKWLIGLGVMVLLVFVSQFILFWHGNLAPIYKNNYYIPMVPVFSFAMVLIYYFRVVLLDYKSVRSQVLQIMLRKVLCQFIESYAAYAKELKDDNELTLRKFEDIIFSGIVADEGKMPATFDGLDQLTKFAQAVTGGRNGTSSE